GSCCHRHRRHTAARDRRSHHCRVADDGAEEDAACRSTDDTGSSYGHGAGTPADAYIEETQALIRTGAWALSANKEWKHLFVIDGLIRNLKRCLLSTYSLSR